MKWLLAIILFISLWSLPGFARKSALYQAPKSQTEVILSQKKSTGSVVPFRKIYSYECIKSIRADLYKSSFGMIIRVHNALAKNTLRHITDRLYSKESFHRFQQVKTIPQCSDEDFFNMLLLRG